MMHVTWQQRSGERHVWAVSRLTLFFATGVLALYAFGILSIGLTKDWRLRHEDNGAMHTTLALSHLQLGLAKTRAHDLFFNPNTGEASVYGHHPPGPALILAGAFAFIGSYSPWVARMVAIVFHLGSLFLLVSLLSRLFSQRTALCGGFLMITLPMSAYFGRMMNYEPLCLFAILIQLTGYAAFKHNGSLGGLAWLCFGILFGGLMDWGSFFFAAAIAGAEAVDALRYRSRSILPLVILLVSAVGIFLFDLWHLWYAGHGSLTSFRDVISHNLSSDKQKFTLMKFFFSQIETFRRYFTHAGLLSSLLVFLCLTWPRTAFAEHLFHLPEVKLVKRLLVIMGGAALGYIVAAPSWAIIHHYWQFYFLPFVVFAMLLMGQLLWRKIPENQALFSRILLVIFLLEVGATSIYMLYLRHTKLEVYAIRQTANFRETYLSPINLEEKEPTTHGTKPDSGGH